MKFIRSKLFILGYLGNLLLIVATFVPIIAFNNQSYAFVDQFFYLSFAIVILATLSLVFITIKKYKIALIPNIINIGIIAYGIYSIFTIDGLQDIENVKKGIALFLYPIGAILVFIGILLTTDSNKNKKIEKNRPLENLNTDQISNIEEPKNVVPNPNIELNFDEQIPLSKILNKEDTVNNLNLQENYDSEPQIEPIKEINNTMENNVIPNIIHENISIDDNQDKIEDNNITEPVQNTNNAFNIINFSNQSNDNLMVDNKNESINNIETSNLIKQDTNETHINEMTNINNMTQNNLNNEENLIQNNSNQEKESFTFWNQNNEQTIANNDSIDEIVDINKNNNQDTEIFMSDIIEKPQSSPLEETRTNTTEFEIPDLSQNNDMMMNHTQIMDKPKQEFMAINPSDMKIDTKKPLFKKKEKNQKEEDPLEKIMKRDIPRTLGRTCQFCNTPLGDDERICPLCGRIN